MAWFKLDDKFHGNPKVMEAGNAAVGLYVRCGTYCADHLTDGKVPKNLAKTYGKLAEIRALVASGLWVENSDSYEMPDYLDFNPSREQVQREQAERHAAKVRAGRAGGVASGVARKQKRSTDEADTEAEAKQIEAPTRPDPTITVTTQLQDSSEPEGVDNSRSLDVAAEYARIALEVASRRGVVGSPEAYAGKARRAALELPELTRLADLFPTAPASVIAAALHGDKHSLAHYPRSDEPQTALRAV